MTMAVKIDIKTSWPWITMLLAAAAALNPVRLDFLHGAFMIGGVLGVLCLLEFGIRQYLVSKQVVAVSAHSDRGPH